MIKLCLLSILFATSPSPPSGPNNYGAVTLENIQSLGVVKLNGTNIAQTVQVTGSLISKGAQMGSLDVQGEANLTDTVIRNGGTVVGPIQAQKTTFQQPLTLVSQRAVFTASKLRGIIFGQDSAFKGKQVLELKQGTIVDGPVTFESGKGEILLYSGSQVLGPVTGGKVLRKN